MRGLDLYRKAGDNQGIAIMSNSMGLVFENQGRIGPAIGALQDAVKAFRDVGDRTSTMAQALNDLAGALAKAGRGTESGKLLEEAQAMAATLKNDGLSAAILNTEGDVYFYRGDLKSAKNSYQQAERLASHASEKDVLLTIKLNLAKVAISDGHSSAVVADLRSLAQQADSLGKKYISVECSTSMAEALIKNKDYPLARQELQRDSRKKREAGIASGERQNSLPLGHRAPADRIRHRGGRAVSRGPTSVGRYP